MTDEVKIALIVAGGPTLVALYNVYQSNKIHTLVNSKMSAALAEIERLKTLLGAKSK